MPVLETGTGQILSSPMGLAYRRVTTRLCMLYSLVGYGHARADRYLVAHSAATCRTPTKCIPYNKNGLVNQTNTLRGVKNRLIVFILRLNKRLAREAG